MEQKRKLIKRIAVFLVIAIIFGSVGRYNYINVEAENIYSPPGISEKEADMWITTDKVNGKKGDIITLTFTYTGQKSILGLDFFIEFDHSLLEVCNYEAINKVCSRLDYSKEDNYFIMMLPSYINRINNGEQFLNIQFKCLADIDYESIIKFQEIAFTFYSGEGYIFEEGYSIKLDPGFCIQVIADKFDGIKKDDIVSFIFRYIGDDYIKTFETFIDFDESLFDICHYEAVPFDRIYNILNYDPSNAFFCLVTDPNASENIMANEQFLKIQFKCLKDVEQETFIKFCEMAVTYRGYLEGYWENYVSSFKLSLSGISEPVPTPTPSVSPSPVPTVPTGSAIVPDCKHLFNDYDYTSPVKGSPVILYGNGINKKIDGNVVNNKQFTAYTDILPSYNYTLNSKGVVKPSSGKVIAGITTSSTKPVVSKNKIVDKNAAKIAKANIKNGQVTVTAAGKEKGLVYLWVIDTGKNGAYECCPVNVLMAPKKLEVQNTSGSKLKNPSISQGGSLDVCVAGIAPGGSKTDDCTYTATVADASQSYVKVTPVQGKNGQFKITATGLKNNKNTKVSITFTCNENKKKVKLAVTIKK